jgi:hypothetical protein
MTDSSARWERAAEPARTRLRRRRGGERGVRRRQRRGVLAPRRSSEDRRLPEECRPRRGGTFTRAPSGPSEIVEPGWAAGSKNATPPPFVATQAPGASGEGRSPTGTRDLPFVVGHEVACRSARGPPACRTRGTRGCPRGCVSRGRAAGPRERCKPAREHLAARGGSHGESHGERQTGRRERRREAGHPAPRKDSRWTRDWGMRVLCRS